MRCGLLGQTLAHSHSPLLHSLLGDYAYTLFEKAPDQVEDFLKNGSWDGLNVTIPYKKTAYALCDSLSPIARETGNVNTLLRRRDGSIFGDNTDAFGFRYLLEKAGVPVAGKRALVLGAGGAGGTACAVLRQMGAAVTVLSRTEKPDDFYGKNNGILYSTYRHISQYKDAQIIVNATPVGMYPHNGEAAVDLEIFPNLCLVADLIYNPARTALLLQAEDLGIPCSGGLSMLAAQAAASAALFLGEAMDISKISQVEGVLRRHRHQSRRILPHQHRHSRCPAGGGSPCRGGAYLRPGKAGTLPPHFLHRHGLPQGHQWKRTSRLPGGHPLSEGAGGKVVFPVDEWPPQWYNACADKAMGKGGREAP